MAHDPALQRSVGADMERIFGPADSLNIARDLEDAPWAPQPPALRRPRRRLMRATIAVVAAALVLVLGLLLARGDPPHASSATGHRQVAAAVPARHAVPAPAPTPAPAATRRITPPEPVSVAATRPAAAATPPAPDRIATAPTVPARPSRTGVSPIVVHPAARRVAVAAVPARLDRQGAPARRPAARAADAACARGRTDDACIYGDVVAADRRLRDAYADAVREGAPVGALVAVRRDWQRARDLSLRQPDETIRRYDRLADELDRLSEAAPR